MRSTSRLVAPLLALLSLGTACSPAGTVSRFAEPQLTSTQGQLRPEIVRPGACYSRDDTPAVIETVTEQMLVQPPEITVDGTVLTPAIYRTTTRQRIVEERERIWFETPCPADLTPDFIASLQRALAARGLYEGPVTGLMDPRTRRAVRVFQADQGLDSGVISVAAAKRLGLIVYTRDETLARPVPG